MVFGIFRRDIIQDGIETWTSNGNREVIDNEYSILEQSRVMLVYLFSKYL